jgi:hypothetical protein
VERTSKIVARLFAGGASVPASSGRDRNFAPIMASTDIVLRFSLVQSPANLMCINGFSTILLDCFL